jgi:hypothetical protein
VARPRRDNKKEVNRAISTSKLRALRRFHIWPINVVVCHGSNGENWF